MTGNDRKVWFAAVYGRGRAIVRRQVAAQVSVAGRCRERDMISDIAQDALTVAAERLDDFRGATEAELVAWVCAIAENKLSDHRRGMRRQRKILGNFPPSLEYDATIAVEADGPREALLREEERRWLRDLTGRLPWRYRMAIRLRYIDGLPVSAVAEQLHCSEAAARGVLKRALRWLRCLVHPLGAPGEV